MHLMIAIIQNEDADLLSKRLNSAGIRLTRLSSIGGFLSSGNVTILAGVEEAQMEVVLGIIRKTCRTRRRYINPTPAGTEPTHLALATPGIPLEVLVGGATIFTFPVKRFARLSGATSAPANLTPRASSEASEAGAHVMNLVLTILQNEDADPVTRALIEAGHRVTRINTAGGFFRRGNITLLVGVEEAQVDDVMQIIQRNCRQRSEAKMAQAGLPAFGATVFVLGAEHFQRI